MSEYLELEAADGHELGAYLARAAPPARGALVIAQEIFGVNAHIRSVVDGYAGEGYDAIAPALFDRRERGVELDYDAAGVARGRELKAGISLEEALADVDAAIRCLGTRASGVVGYCWGGLLAWAAAARLEALDTAVAYYGEGISEHLHLTPRCPILLHFGEQDSAIPAAAVDKVRAAFPDIPLHLYPAGHGFNCDARGSYHAPSAALARQRTLDFLARHLAAGA